MTFLHAERGAAKHHEARISLSAVNPPAQPPNLIGQSRVAALGARAIVLARIHR